MSRSCFTYSVCPACGQAIDHCPGHGEMGDPRGRAILDAHEAGDHTMCNRHAECLPFSDFFEVRDDATYYTGPFEPALLHVLSNDRSLAVGHYRESHVFTCYLSTDTHARAKNCDEFGVGLSAEDAIRFALGAYFGPVDDEYPGDDHFRSTVLYSTQAVTDVTREEGTHE